MCERAALCHNVEGIWCQPGILLMQVQGLRAVCLIKKNCPFSFGKLWIGSWNPETLYNNVWVEASNTGSIFLWLPAPTESVGMHKPYGTGAEWSSGLHLPEETIVLSWSNRCTDRLEIYICLH